MKPLYHTFAWMLDLGITPDELKQLNPCVPGEFTLPDTLYVNTATPRAVYRGTAEGTLPLVAGRWYLIPEDIAAAHPQLGEDTSSVAAAASRAR